MFDRILIAVDLSHLDDAQQAVQTALTLNADNPNAVYRVMTVIPNTGSSFVSSFLPSRFDQDVMEEANRALHEFTDKYFPKNAKIQHIVAHGAVYEEINRVAHEKHIDLIIMMAIREGRDGLSSNTLKVARDSDHSVLILR